MPSISDTARSNCLTELGLTSSSLSLMDLFRLVRDDPGQTTWTFNANLGLGKNLENYLNALSG